MEASVDTIVIGGSAGSLEALKAILPSLPGDLPATVLVCQHRSPESMVSSAGLLRSFTELAVIDAEDGRPLTHGDLLVAPSDRHMLIGRDHIHLRRGAHENSFRPAIDPLFRSAALYRGTRTIGVILSGLLDDGASGARALERTGGRVVVQDPLSADFANMPRATLDVVETAESVPLDSIADRLLDLVGRPAAPTREVPMDIGIEVKIASLEGASMANEEKLGDLSPYNCPDCNGVLWMIEDGPLTRFRCHTGHAYTTETLAVNQAKALERSLFDSLRAHRGRVALLEQMAKKAGPESAKRLRAKAALVAEDARTLEEILRQTSGPTQSIQPTTPRPRPISSPSVFTQRVSRAARGTKRCCRRSLAW